MGKLKDEPMVIHWRGEKRSHFGWSLAQYVYFGGYPGAATFADERDPSRWINYINDSLIETAISRDILLMTQVHKPALLRRLFQLGCLYSGQILSYNKMLGQLQDTGNTTTLAHYLELLDGAGLLSGLQKYTNQKVRQKGSSPKFSVYNTALMSAQSGKTFVEAQQDRAFWGRLVESAVGAHILNGIRGTQIEVFYWREGSKEVDFVLKRGSSITAIEVKSIYLLIALLWAMFYALIEAMFPGSFTGLSDLIGEVTREEFLSKKFDVLLYYSFVTLTTLGYGDITPSLSIAKSLSVLEAVVGQFYIAILVAGLVGSILRRNNSDA